MRILKFGGTSLKNAEKFLLVTNIIHTYLKNEEIAVVVSAPATITNNLDLIIKKSIKKKNYQNNLIYIKNFFWNLLNELKKKVKNLDFITIKNKIDRIFSKLEKLLNGIDLINNCPDIIQAKILSKGEQFSVILINALLKIKKYKTYIISPKKYLLTYDNNNYLEATINISLTKKKFENIKKLININVMIMAGFSAVNDKKETVLLGRNGSDYSAAVLAVCLEAKYCEIWTDVNGIYTADPNVISKAQLLDFISYKEAITLSYFGAKVLHYKTIFPMLKNNIPCIVKNIKYPKNHGTLISKNILNNEFIKIKGITELKNISILYINGEKNKQSKNIMSKILHFIFKLKISIYFITQSTENCNLSIGILNNNVQYLKNLLEEEFYLELKHNLINPFSLVDQLSIISLVGNKINNSINIISKFLNIFNITKTNIVTILQNFSQNYISVIINENHAHDVIQTAHKILFHNMKILEIFIVGIGGVGNAFLQQIHQQKCFLEKKSINIKICGIISTKFSLINFCGIDLKNWKTEIKKLSCSSSTIENLLQNIKKHNLVNPVIIDCTSSKNIADQYLNFLNHGLHIIATNKKANSSTSEYYNEIRFKAKKLNLNFFYGTNVGAGLPVINTLQNLLKTGSRITKFVGILSGSLSFIFGKLEEGITLSKSIKIAQDMGFTEPDPRIDLSGIDVARKLLILAREIGFNLELSDIKIEPIIPHHFNHKISIEKFFDLLPEIDNVYKEKIDKINNENKVLRYIGSIDENGICKVKLKKIDNNHPFFNIKNGENAFAFYTDYYQPQPLVLRGYGAGNNVTAAGVFTDLLRIII
ncbi:bifunctional aspartate kinase/homoserine dehydrogenase I [Enterobacteriaceae endosymbiont of Donacia tomentosa]|uniref:bifunctional aspartate kinase/homoserine dehydrogenase I n=1 Tax=Enterobacteriaceae endosymbiont of Donacia tomentosa TaxID=2675787 RepID=UPI001449F34A|nr:bifunctional aspartate kinase/homoserine dehydrogenase I [Enterobacteriaceae endosymbiont of Donacia tomentosa]QJC31804.1 bifunctional aspartate kinase/homoserine dehydrogenase I [Enterobacteriaceae endosymbiont of Donacia tomentosa]